MDIRAPTLVREIDPQEPWVEVVNEAKALTWQLRCEVALMRVDDGQLLLVSGGADGIEFEVAEDSVWIECGGKRRRVTLLAWHTHPRPTGPSDHDRAFLRVLGQDSSVVYEMFADGAGTRFRASDAR